MTAPDHPQIYLLTPAEFDPEPFAGQLAAALDAVPVACLRLRTASQREEDVIRAADAVRAVALELSIVFVLAFFI